MSGAERVFPPAVKPGPPAPGGKPAGKSPAWAKDKRVWGVLGAGVVVALAMFSRGGSSSSGTISDPGAGEPVEPGESSYSGGGSSGGGGDFDPSMYDAITGGSYDSPDELPDADTGDVSPAEPAEIPEQGDTPTAIRPQQAKAKQPQRGKRGPKPGRGKHAGGKAPAKDRGKGRGRGKNKPGQGGGRPQPPRPNQPNKGKAGAGNPGKGRKLPFKLPTRPPKNKPAPTRAAPRPQAAAPKPAPRPGPRPAPRPAAAAARPPARAAKKKGR